MPTRSWPVHAGLSLLWGLSTTLVVGVVLGFGWAAAAALTSFSAAVAIAASVRLGGRRLERPARAQQMVILAGAIAVQNLGLCFAIAHVGIALTAVVLGSMPLFATLFGQVWGVDRITVAAAAGLATGFIGLLIVVVFPPEGDSWASLAGIFAALVSAIAAGFAIRYSTLLLRGRPGVAVGAHLIAGAALLPLALLTGGRPGSVWGYLALLALVVVATAVAPVLELHMPDAGQGAHAGMVKTLGLVVAALAGVLFLGERLDLGQVVGMVLLLVGAALVLELLPTRSRLR